ncbi:MAG TPA: penicillin-binding transpeptidase domain-containing protein [Verrucomicrobiae bacterium]|nr:penicillin-binding transpeptidase domain-containing protein [Verrucomicrobiae bacterium]
MLVFDQLQKNDPQLRLLAQIVFAGVAVLLAGLWWVQVVSYRDYQAHLETQSFRTVRIPAVRGKIFDRNGVALADSQPNYSVSLYLEDLRKRFDGVYTNDAAIVRRDLAMRIANEEKRVGHTLTPTERRPFLFDTLIKSNLVTQAHLQVVNGIVAQVSAALREQLPFDPKDFIQHYKTRLALPYPLVPSLDPLELARFEECDKPAGVDLETQARRYYPFKTVAAHLLGHLQSDDTSKEGEESDYDYRLPDFRGDVGLEYGFDAELRGHAGGKSVLVNNVGFRQTENIWSPVEPGSNLVLTIDVRIQQVAEEALRSGPMKADTHGAVVVMDVHTGDILALASAPSFDPNMYLGHIRQEDFDKMQASGAEHNRATGENLAPGSIFKPIVGLACLENGLNPNATIYNAPNPNDAAHGHIMIGKRLIKDTAAPGDYDFRRAILRSSNTYFITNGLRYAGAERIVTLGRKFYLGEKIGLPTHQETAGEFPTLERVRSANWHDGDTANICFGQGEIAVTPLQMAVVYSAFANGGTILWPRLIDRIEPPDPLTGTSIVFDKSRVRDQIGVSARSMAILKDALLAETEDPEGTGQSSKVPGLRICGKTGTAQVQDSANHFIGYNFWFASFAPYENPRYVVIVTVESKENGSGGSVCAPIAHDIYAALQKYEMQNIAHN